MTLETDVPVLDSRLRGELRQSRRDFLMALEPVRAALYRYCRSLTGNTWDAEDLLQDTLTRGLAEASRRHEPIQNAEAWLIRIATNSWIDARRRSGRTSPLDWTDPGHDLPAAEDADPLAAVEVESALRQLLLLLPPQERACVVLKDVFAYPLAEIAGMLETTTGAVKSALHRGRSSLQAAQAKQAAQGKHAGANPAPGLQDGTAPTQPTAHAVVLRQLTEAFNAYDIDAMVRLFLSTGRTEVIGNVSETGHEEIRTGSLSHTFGPDAAELYRASIHWFDGEEVILLWERQKDAPEEPELVSDVLRVRNAGGEPLISQLSWYFFCPELIAEVAGGLGLPFKTNGVSYF
jgi:RNA polymerase sigma-70 factor (ECF subfamily)